MNWNTTKDVPPLKRVRHSPFAVESERLLLWIDDSNFKGFAFGRAFRFSDDDHLIFSAEGFNGNWNITHWQSIQKPDTQ